MVKTDGFDMYSHKSKFIKFKIIDICNKFSTNLNQEFAKAKV